MSSPCPGCGEPLDESIYTADRAYKSCPSCSQARGRHAFRRIDDFGLRNTQGRQYIQSHCPECRGKQTALSPAFSC